MRVWIFCCLAAALVGLPARATTVSLGHDQQQEPTTGRSAAGSGAGKVATPSEPAMSDEEKANELSQEVGKLMVECVNLLTAQDPASLGYCKQQRDLADEYPPRQRLVDKLLAHDEYGIALAAFDRQRDALAEFNEEIKMLPQAVKPGTVEWSTAYWHRAMVHFELGEYGLADRDYRAAEASFRKHEREEGEQHPDGKMKAVLRQHAIVLEREGKPAEAQKLLAEAAQ